MRAMNRIKFICGHLFRLCHLCALYWSASVRLYFAKTETLVTFVLSILTVSGLYGEV